MNSPMTSVSLCITVLLSGGLGLVSPLPSSAAKTTEAPQDAPSVSENLKPCMDRIDRFRTRNHVVEPMIATLPDPLDSHFGREFDLLLASIVQSLEGLGYTRDLHCLPWRDEGTSEPLRAFLEEPGILIFRKAAETEGDHGSLVPVLVVGETPMAGVHTDAMSRALELAYEQAARPEVSPGSLATREIREIRLLGPTFSGSASSVNIALDEWRLDLEKDWEKEATEREAQTKCKRRRERADPLLPGVTVRIRSGSATVDEVGDKLLAGLNRDGSHFQVEEFRLTAASNLDLLGCTWNRFIPERLKLRTRLPESLNAGLSAAHPCSARTSSMASGSDNNKVALVVESSAYGRDFEGADFHVVQFPMHVSRLRDLYERNPELRRSDDSWPREDGNGSDLRLLRPSGGMPTFGGDITLASQEKELHAILEDLADRRFEVVGVVATDVMDQRFLVEQIRSRAPGSRVVAFGKDLLLAHDQPGGVLVASSFSADASHRGWSSSRGRDDHDDGLTTDTRSRLSMDASEGVYHAVHELVTKKRSLRENAVWLSVTGQSRLHTLAQYDIPDSDAGFAAPSTEPVRSLDAGPVSSQLGDFGGIVTHLPGTWILALGLFTAALLYALGHAWGRLVFEGKRSGATSDAASAGPLFGLIPTDLLRPRSATPGLLPSSSDRALHAFVVLLPLLVGVPYLVLGLPAVSEAGSLLVDGADVLSSAWNWAGRLGLMVSLVLVLLAVTILYLLVTLLIRTAIDLWRLGLHRREHSSGAPWKERRRQATGMCIPLAATLAVVAIAVFWLIIATTRLLQEYGEPQRQAMLFVQKSFFGRSLSATSGASPLLPPMLFGSVLVGWIVLCLLRFRVRRAIPTREEIGLLARQGISSDLRRHIVRLRSAIDPASLLQSSKFLWPLLVATPVLYLTFYYGRPVAFMRSLEGDVFDLTVTILFVLAVAVSIGAGLSLYRGWSSLREILEWLDLGDRDAEKTAGWLERVREAYADSAKTKDLAESRRVKTLEALHKELGRSRSRYASDLRVRLETVDLRLGSQPAGRWLLVADWWQTARRWLYEKDENKKDQLTPLGAAALNFFVWSIVRFVRDAFAQLLQIMAFMTTALLVLLLAVSIYPFEPQRLLAIYLSTLIALGASLSLWVVLQARKQKLLGALDGGEKPPWQILMGRLSAYAGLPVFGVIANRLPGVRQILIEWLEPVVKALG